MLFLLRTDCGLAKRGAKLESIIAGFAGADADGLFDGADKNLAIANFIGAGSGDDCLNRGIVY